jgi:hypothetical protein
MRLPIIRPKGRFQELVLDGQRVQKLHADPYLVFAVADAPHSPKPIIPGVTQWHPFACYRLREDALSEGILHPVPSSELRDYIEMKNARIDALSSLHRGHGEAQDFSHPILYLTQYLLKAPDIQLTPDARMLPKGSLLLCDSRSGFDGLSDVWVSYTPDEQKAHSETLKRGCGMVMETGEKFLSLKTAFADSVKHITSRWPRANRIAHLADFKLVRTLG